MNNKRMSIFVMMLFMVTIASASGTILFNNSDNAELILQEIDATMDKSLVFDDVIGDIHVTYWEHTIGDVCVKNDYIVLHRDVHTKDMLSYTKSWSDVNVNPSNSIDRDFEPENYVWKKIVVFPDELDCSHFYTFDEGVEYPFVCWEVRHTDGTTILYQRGGTKIGWGIPAPSKGFSLSGYNDASWPDPWIEFRENADNWFTTWCSSTVSISLPSLATISSHISDPTTDCFYELAHGDEHYFQADAANSNYYASTLQSDMEDRQPIRFAFLGSCHGMTSTGPGTFSYEFRKGQLTNTVTVGFDHMENCPGWEYGWYWQNSLFENMSKGLTIKESFDVATARYPTIEPAVVFLGDETLKAFLIPDLYCEGELRWEQETPGSEITGEFTLSNIGEEDSMLDWEITDYPSEWGTWEFSQAHGEDLTPEQGEQKITVTLTVPQDKNAEFIGEIKIINTHNPTDYDVIPITLTTPKHKGTDTMILRFLEQHPYLFPMLRQWLAFH